MKKTINSLFAPATVMTLCSQFTRALEQVRERSYKESELARGFAEAAEEKAKAYSEDSKSALDEAAAAMTAIANIKTLFGVDQGSKDSQDNS